MLSYLFVVAHPDDEILGAGGTIVKLVELGHKVSICFMSGNVEARVGRPSLNRLTSNIEEMKSYMGIDTVIKGNFKNISFNTSSHLELVEFIENAILETKANIIFTHHPSDLNNDHYHTSISCQAASKLSQRRNDVTELKELLFMEVLSATDWSLNTSLKQFTPNVFIAIKEKRLIKKIKALDIYDGVMRDYPHPRSEESIRGLAAYRGSQSGSIYAEAFESVFRKVDFSLI